MKTCIIIDDEKNAREALDGLIRMFFESNLMVLAVCDAVKSGVEAIKRYKPDVIFLDIEMPEENGLQLFKYFDKPTFDVIFTTAYEKYAIQAFKFSALDYLLKPINKHDLSESIKRLELKQKVGVNMALHIESLISNLNPEHSEFAKIAFPTMDGFELEKISNIIYCKADGNYSDIYLKNNDVIKTSKTLKHIVELLPQELFFRIHKKYLINLNYLNKYSKFNGGDVILDNGTMLPVSERNKPKLVNKLQNKNK